MSPAFPPQSELSLEALAGCAGAEGKPGHVEPRLRSNRAETYRGRRHSPEGEGREWGPGNDLATLGAPSHRGEEGACDCRHMLRAGREDGPPSL